MKSFFLCSTRPESNAATKFYTSERSILWYPKKLCYFLRLSWKFFSGLFRPPEQWNDQSLKCLLFCDRFICVTLVVSSFLYLNIFQSALNLVQIFVNAIPRDDFLFRFLIFKFYFFFYFFSFLGHSQFLEVKSRPFPNRIFMAFM